VQPIQVSPEETTPISFQKVLIKIPPGKLLGSHHDGLARVPQFRYYWQTSVLVGDAQLNQIACDELRNAGYSVVGEPISVFESGDEWKARFLLGGTVLDALYSTYARLAGNFSKASLTIKWELMDKSLRKVIYEKTTNGTAVVKGVGIGAAFEAFKDSIRKLLSEEEFSVILAKKPEAASPTIETKGSPIFIKKTAFPQYIKASDFVQNSIQAVVTLKTEGGHGSGFIISEDGYTVTNFHVVSGKHLIDIMLPNRITLQAEVVKVDPELDLALLKLKGSGFPTLPIGDSDRVGIGEEVFSIGTPASMELGQSVSKGIISGIRRIEEKDYLQTDVKINPGNSGGPLVNSKGEVVGVITMKLAGKRIEGLAFAIPINVVNRSLNIISK
jgi:S1-C subfamily serine protease